MTTTSSDVSVDDTVPGVVNWTTTRADRGELLACTYCDAAPGDPCEPDRPDFSHVGRRWAVGITAPGSIVGRRPAGGGSLVAVTDTCAPTVEDVNDPAHGRSKRGACLSLNCGWVGPTRDSENDAVEDALDHTHPGWRDLPIVERAKHDANDKQVDAWRNEINRIYRALGHREHLCLPGGVIRTARTGLGTRSHWAHPVGGYDVFGQLEQPVEAPASTGAAPTLF